MQLEKVTVDFIEIWSEQYERVPELGSGFGASNEGAVAAGPQHAVPVSTTEAIETDDQEVGCLPPPQ